MRTLLLIATAVCLTACFSGGGADSDDGVDETPVVTFDAGGPFVDAGPRPDAGGPTLDAGKPSLDAGGPVMMPSPVMRDDISEVCAPGGFCWELPHPQGHDLRAIWGASADDAWAVGEGGLLLHYDGEQFEYHDPMSEGVLRSVHGRSADDIWAVGDRGALAHFDGDEWSAETLADFDAKLSDPQAALFGVWVADDGQAFAVGHNGNKTIIGHFDGKDWIDQSAMLPTSTRMHSVWGLSPTDVWAVGDNGTILHYDGAAWSQSMSPTPSNLYSVHAFKDEVWAAGANGTVLRLSAGVWTLDSVADLVPLRAIRADGRGPWVFGEGGVIYRRTGGAWIAQSSGKPQRDFYGAWRIDKETFIAVGDHGLVQHWDDDTRQTLSFGPTNSLLGIWGDNRGLWVVGDELLLRDSIGWVELANPGANSIFDVWGQGDEIWAVGTGGTVLQYSDGDWTDVSTPEMGESLLYAVWSNGSTTFVVGEQGRANRLVGDNWIGAPVTAFVDFFDVWGTSDSNVYAVGESGLVMRWDGSSWRNEPIATPGVTTLRGVWGSGQDDVFVVGDFGTILHYDGSLWSVQEIETVAALHSVHGTGADDVWAVGAGGTILHYDGNAWEVMPSGTIRGLEGVWAEPGGAVWAIGRDGTVLVRMP